MSGLTVYKASAGAGKTFTLAVEYMKLLIQNPRAYRHILAVTFTNKATGEMKERILGQLYALSRELPESAPYRAHLVERLSTETGDAAIDSSQITHRAAQALSLLIHDYGRFRVETIDSFFQSVMRNLARELDLSPNLNIELDTDKVLAEAVEELFRNLTPHSDLMRWILEYIDEKISDDKHWNVMKEICNFGRTLMNEEYITHGASLRLKLRDPKYITRFRKLLLDLAEDLEKGFKSLAERFQNELSATSLSIEDLARKEKGIASYFRKIESCEGLNDEKVRTSTLLNSLENPEAWTTKTSPRRDEVIHAARAHLIPLLRETEAYRQKYWGQLLSCRLSLTHLYKVGLLAYIDEEMHEQNYRRNRFLLAETNHLLHSLIKEDDPSFVFEKTGTQIRNIMIDEFQDTSRLQWNNFRLLLTEGLSQGADSMIVGDVKQSIYRWRGGNWEILGGLKGMFGNYPVTERHLTVNRRSETHIIQFNNLFFTRAVGILDQRYLEESGESCESLTDAYSDVAQQSPRVQQKGRVSVQLFDGCKKEDYETRTLEGLLKAIEQLSAQGVLPRDMAILLRTKKHIPVIAAWFAEQAPQYKVVSDEAFLLQASAAVEILIHALHCLAAPEDTVSLTALAGLWQAEVRKTRLPLEEIQFPRKEKTDTQIVAKWLPDGWSGLQDEFSALPLYELLERFVSFFELDTLTGQDAYLMTFFDGLNEYLQDGEPSPEAFLTHWDETLYKRAIPSGETDGIRMLSIHASKGLEFHTVLIPFCDWELQSSRHQELVWCSPQEAPFSDMDLIPVNFSKNMADSIYHVEYAHERLQQWVDNLNLLYVAFTRASANLVVWTKTNEKNGMGQLLLEALDKTTDTPSEEQSDTTGNAPEDVQVHREEEEGEEGSVHFWYGDETYLASSQPVPAEVRKNTETELPALNIFTDSPTPLPARMVSYQPKIEFKQSNRSADFIAAVNSDAKQQQEYINQGQLMHTLFSSIGTQDDLQPALQRLLFEGVVSPSQLEEAARIASRALKHPDVQNWYNGSYRLYNECTILYPQHGKTEIRRPDRVMLAPDHIVVVDFKFGVPQKAHKKQVMEYMELLRKMGHTTVKGYLWYVYKNEIVNVAP